MPRIDPLSLLKCLSVLLGPSGGIKSKEEVNRLANLMTKFSKKLVSKCIYIQILKVTNSDLLSQFMAAEGWKLIHSWLQDGIAAKNWELVQELLELLLLCPVDIERLKSNNCPKMVKGLSKEGQPIVKTLASRLVEQWLKIVKGEAPPNSVPIQIATAPMAPQPSGVVTADADSTSNQMQMMDVTEPESCEPQQQATTIQVQDFEVNNTDAVNDNQPKFQEQIHIQPVQLQIVNKKIAGQSQPTQIKKQSFVVVTTTANHHNHHSPTVPVYKITIRDGKQVLTKVETDSTNIKNLLINDSAKNNVDTSDINEDSINMSENNLVAVENNSRTLNSNVSDNISGEVMQDKFNNQVDNVAIKMDNNVISTSENDNNHEENNDVKNLVNSEGNNKSSDKENLDSSHKKDDNKSISSSSNSSSDKKTSSSHHSSRSSSKHSSSSRSSSHKSSHRSSSSKSSSSRSSSSRDKDRHHSSKHSSSSSGKSSRSEREKEREKEKEKMKKDQAEKDKATLEKIQGQGSLGTKFGKIPKKKPGDDETGDSLRKSSTDSRDSSKENKDSKKVSGVLEKKNISISIENRKNSQEISQRPKTVKTFNSKFRSTGLEEEIKPPPPRTAGKKNSTAPISTVVTSTDKKLSSPKVQSLKRSSPLRETGASADKKPRLSLDTPSTPPLEDKKGAIKLIPPKPKPMVLQESDMFMDALMTASTKSKEPRKRKRRTSISKDSDAKKTDGSNSADASSRDGASSPLSSPQGGDDRSSLPIKPEFKFYQDTLETDEDKEEKDDESEEKVKDRMDEEDDDRSRTPTCEDEVEDPKAPASPDDLADAGRKEGAASPNDEIRYVDGLRSVLLLQKRKGPKKNLKWKTELESVRYFELDETERVNVTKTFTDMKQMEKQGEREAFQMARKLSNEDTMEEKTRWTTLVPIDLPAPLVEPGKESREKDIQYAREKGILQALYFNRSMIPDSPAEPDEERHHIMADPKAIPLDDLTGNKESEKDFTSMAWPEPKPQLPPVTPIVQNIHFPTFPQHNPVIPGLPMPPGSLGMNSLPQPLSQQLPQPLMPPMNHMPVGVGDVGAGGWRTGDGKVVVPDVSMNNMAANVPTNFPPPNMDPSMMPPNMMAPPGMYNQPDGYQGMTPNDDGNFGHMSNNFQGPAMFGPGNFQPLPPRGAQMNPMHGGNRGRGGPGWFRGNVAPMRGGWNNRGAGVGGNAGGGGWRNNGKQPPICRQFTKTGYCRSGDKCVYLHPGVNYPPF